MLKGYVRKLRNGIRLLVFKFRNSKKTKFECPICGYTGPFKDLAPITGVRRHAQCPCCNALERHRLQFIVVSDILRGVDTANSKMLHFAPEKFLRDFFCRRFGKYETADLFMEDVDHTVDLQQLPFADQTFDFVFASHVLEHIPDDERAISEIRRILKPNGIAILPVPVVGDKTVEYPEPNPHEANHVRAPGIDYFERYERQFARVEKFNSASISPKYQPYIYEDRTKWPTRECPLRIPMEGEKHLDIVPVCYV